VRALSLAPSAQPIERNPQFWSDAAQFDLWRIGLRRKVLTQRAITLYRTRCRATVALPAQILAVDGVFSLIQRVSDPLNGRFAKKDAIR
jgi:hypothetical protein